MDQNCVKDYNNSSIKIIKTHSQLVAKVYNFSSENDQHLNHLPKIEYYTNSLHFKNNFYCKVYPNGTGSENKGYVSIYFCIREEYEWKNIFNGFNFDCTISVLDTNESKRFLQSFVFHYRYSEPDNRILLPVFSFDKYILRKTLLEESLDFLPGDILTIHLEINLLEHIIDFDFDFDALSFFVFEKSVITKTDTDGGNKYYLCLDSVLAAYLYATSSYFRCVATTPMIEKDTGYVEIPSEEYPFFFSIWLTLRGSPFMVDESDYDIGQLYSIAVKYDIPCVTQTCRLLLKRNLSLENVANVSELADRYNDISLKEHVETFTKCNDSSVQLKQEDLKMEWCSRRLAIFLPALQHIKTVNKESTIDNEDTAFSFYS